MRQLSLALPAALLLLPPTAVGQAAAPRPTAAAVPSAAKIKRAEAYAGHRLGRVGFAVVDSQGHVHGVNTHVGFRSASLVKAMLLVAYMREGMPLGSEQLETLRAMIEESDNVAASVIYGQVGDDGLEAVASAAGMRDFTTLGSWGDNNLTAFDQARFFYRMPALLPKRDRALADELLTHVVSYERWGIPAAATGWQVAFKGGWRPVDDTPSDDVWLVHQAAYLTRGQTRIAIAILTESPSMAYGEETLEAMTQILLGG